MANIYLCPNNVHPLDFAISEAVRACDQRPAEQPLDFVLVYAGLESAVSKAARSHSGDSSDTLEFAFKFLRAISDADVVGLIPPSDHPDYSILLGSLAWILVDAAKAGPAWDFILWNSVSPRLVHLLDARYERTGYFRHVVAQKIRQALLSREAGRPRDRLIRRIDDTLAGVVTPDLSDCSDSECDASSEEYYDEEIDYLGVAEPAGDPSEPADEDSADDSVEYSLGGSADDSADDFEESFEDDPSDDSSDESSEDVADDFAE